MEILRSKKSLIFILGIFVVVALVMFHFQTDYGRELTKMVNELRRSEPMTVSCENEEASEYYRLQRNTVSRQLNDMMKQFGQQNCQLIKYKDKSGEKVDSGVSENGGWCSELSGESSPAHVFDEGFATAISKFLAGKVVASFGDGPGMYKKDLDKRKEVKSYTAYDGAPYCENTTAGTVQFLDLTAPQYGLPVFDWVISVEVGEHIPKQFQDVYMDNLVRHAKEGIILSWAVPGQGGRSHINNRPFEKVVEAMRQRYFTLNKTDGEPLRSAASFYWLKNNVHVYRRLDPNTFKPTDT